MKITNDYFRLSDVEKARLEAWLEKNGYAFVEPHERPTGKWRPAVTVSFRQTSVGAFITAHAPDGSEIDITDTTAW